MKRKSIWLNHFFNFLAVILGVYLAFYMNERAENMRNQKEADVILESLMNDMAGDVETYENYQIPVNKQQLDSLRVLIDILTHERDTEIGPHLSAVFQLDNFAPTTSTYSSIKDSGKLGLIKNLELQKSISSYYESLAEESMRKSEYQAEYFTSELLSWITDNVDLTTAEILHPEELIVLRNKLMIYESLIDQKVASYEALVSGSKELQAGLATALTSD